MTAEQFTTAVTFLFISTASQSPHETSSHRQQILKKKKAGKSVERSFSPLILNIDYGKIV